MKRVTLFYKSGNFITCENAKALELAVSMLTYSECDLMVIVDDDDRIYPIELIQQYKITKEG